MNEQGACEWKHISKQAARSSGLTRMEDEHHFMSGVALGARPGELG